VGVRVAVAADRALSRTAELRGGPQAAGSTLRAMKRKPGGRWTSTMLKSLSSAG
jgi:hypothetical protein